MAAARNATASDIATNRSANATLPTRSRGPALGSRIIARTRRAPRGASLTVDCVAVTGIWSERTDRNGHYKGFTFHGAVQMILNPVDRRMDGMWVGFSRDMCGVSTARGAWCLAKAFTDSTDGCPLAGTGCAGAERPRRGGASR